MTCVSKRWCMYYLSYFVRVDDPLKQLPDQNNEGFFSHLLHEFRWPLVHQPSLSHRVQLKRLLASQHRVTFPTREVRGAIRAGWKREQRQAALRDFGESGPWNILQKWMIHSRSYENIMMRECISPELLFTP